ncbi:TIGR00282 family metallophosphoesterase [Fodinibius salsisoli]|uniref:TIGR00282 family metallophosphoesterase n=1 Tax=Fodinibius salsisoli TaxID=2820877 RepID=A0ABT3PKJ0_9BACT|nr:TIGR00282 family metallophosphoesterase [Fodinibius salsisoli]MCW9706460.1 TIGR00282 family metallophosphoesterase [Fodinibius salsisoli]
MSKSLVNILFVGDIVGEPGLSLLETILPSLIKKHEADFVIANGENSHKGKGINRSIIKRLYDLGVHVITGGNHSFAKWKVFDYMKEDGNILRPMNYPRGNPGYGFGVYEIPDFDQKIGVLNLQGRTFMQAIDDPFSTADWVIERMKEETDIIFIDFHAEATAEKLALAWHLDGEISIFVGTHTHIPTHDARIFPKGTGYISDVGMTGSFDSVLGMDKHTSMKRFKLGTPHRYKLANGNNHLCAIVAKVDTSSGLCEHIEPIIYPDFHSSNLEK